MIEETYETIEELYFKLDWSAVCALRMICISIDENDALERIDKQCEIQDHDKYVYIVLSDKEIDHLISEVLKMANVYPDSILCKVLLAALGNATNIHLACEDLDWLGCRPIIDGDKIEWGPYVCRIPNFIEIDTKTLRGFAKGWHDGNGLPRACRLVVSDGIPSVKFDDTGFAFGLPRYKYFYGYNG